MTLIAKRLDGGGELTWRAFTRLEISASLDTPVVSLTCTLPVERFPPRMGEITVREGEKTLFAGRVDKQSTALDARGRLLTLDARDRGALLLDNEATPCVLTNLQLSALFQRCAAPYGFILYNPNPGGSLAVYTIHKGQSQWDALCGFVRRVNGRTPTLRDGVVLVDRPGVGPILRIGGEEQPYSRLEHTMTPYTVLSQVVLRDADGGYSSSVFNREAAQWGIRRVRYVIPSNEFVDMPGLDANQRLRRSMRDMERVVVRLPELVDACPGQLAQLRDAELELANLLVETAVHTIGAEGRATTLRLARREYYD